MTSFKDRTKPDRKKIVLLDSGETFHAEFAAPDPGFEGNGENGTPLNAAVFTEIHNAIDGAQTLAESAMAQAQQTEKSVERLSADMANEFKQVKSRMETEFQTTRALVQKLFNLTQNLNDFLSQGLTAQELDLLSYSAGELDDMRLSAFDLDYKSQIYLARRL